MSTIMESAFANTKEGKGGASPTKPSRTTATATPAAPRLTSADVRARRLARLTSKADTTRIIDESVITDYVEISEERRGYERELEPLKRKSSTIPVEQLNSARANLESKIRSCDEELAALVGENPTIVAAVARREELRASARSDIQAFKRLDPTNFDRESVEGVLANAVRTGTLKVSSGSYVAAVEDSVLQELEGRVDYFLAAVKTVREEEKQKRIDRVSAYLLSDLKPKGGGDSPLQEEKRKPGKVSFTRLRVGEGERSFVPVHGTKKNETGEPTGEEYFMGEVIVERRDDKPTVVMATRVRLTEILFFHYNREKDELQERGFITLPSDLERIQPNLLREALQRQFVRDAESADRCEKATLLATVELYKDAGTFADLRVGEAKRWIVNAPWTPDGKKRETMVTFHVESDGEQFHIGETACDLEEVDKAFFGSYMKPSPLAVLSTDKRWGALAAQNRPFERDWLLRRAASAIDGNVTFITRENVANFLGLGGVDGVYAAPARWEQRVKGGERSDAPRYVAIGFIGKRRGEKIHFSYGTPGVGEGVIEKEQDTYPVSDLPIMTRAVARAIWMSATRDWETVPDHLKAATPKPTNR